MVDVSDYIEDSKNFLEEVKNIMNKNIDSALYQGTNKIIKKEFFPDDEVIKDLYGDVFASYYSGLHNASLSVAMELLEYMSRKLYKNIYTKECPEKWYVVMKDLLDFFKDDEAAKFILKSADAYREKVRNSQLHGNILELVEKNTRFYHNVINVRTGERTEVGMKYDKNIHGKERFLEAKDAIQNEGTNNAIFLINVFIIHFFIIKAGR